MNNTNPLSSCATAAALAVLAAGCSELTATVGGKVLLDDQPLKVTDDQRGMVVFRPVAGGATCTGLINGESVYSISTGSASSLAPGDYMVSVRVIQLQPSTVEGGSPTGTPVTPAVYADPLTSGLSVYIKRGKNRYDIDLDSSAGPVLLPREAPFEEEPFDEEETDVDETNGAESSNAVATDGQSPADDPSNNADPATDAKTTDGTTSNQGVVVADKSEKDSNE